MGDQWRGHRANFVIDQALEGLNKQQREAVLHEGKALLILAGAGSGKTRVITVKIAYLIEQMGVDPRSILAVTFTNKAAKEMRERAESLSPAAGKVVIRTFHSFGAWLLRRNQAVLDLAPNFTIYDDEDSLSLLASIFPDASRQEVQRWNHLISRAKDNCLTPTGNLEKVSKDPQLGEIYAAYEDRLRTIGNVDFGDLIVRPIELLRREPIIAERIRHRFSIILVDEYQDSNSAQYILLQELYSSASYICVVGDDDQSIYRFRGAEVRNILAFPQQFGSADIIKLEQNYRSTNPILKLAGRVVQQNTGRLGKELWTEKKGGAIPRVVRLSDQDDEVDYVVGLIRDDFPGETAILYRTNAQSRLFETRFLREKIPYRIIGTLRFYEREEIKDAVSLLKLLANRRDEVAFSRIVNKPARGIGQATVGKILARGLTTGENLLQATAYVAARAPRKTASGLANFMRIMEGAEAMLGGGQKHLGELLEKLLEHSGLSQYYLAKDEAYGMGKLQNLEELANAASLYASRSDGLADFLEAIELEGAREHNDVDAQVTLITMHNTKGLEFDRVVVTGLEDGLFPRHSDTDELEEERRLFYVAITRAKEELHITYCGSRRVHGRTLSLDPSVFLTEIGNDLVEWRGQRWRSGGEKNVFGEDDPWRPWRALPQRGSAARPGNATSDVASSYIPGQLVYHDEYGVGEVIKSSHNGTEEIIHVRFESGKAAQFIPRFSPIEKISRD